MSNNTVISEKKKALLAYKEKLLEEIKSYENSIVKFRAEHKKKRFYQDHDNSSDSEDDFPHAINMGPTMTDLKRKDNELKTRLRATLELTNMTVVQSEITVLVKDPKLEGERPVIEQGTWREVTAECRIDIVPFTITFLVHTPIRKFGQQSFRGLRVVPVKKVQEIELAKSVLHTLKLPSDATEVLRNYAAGYRSRRTTLQALADKYGSTLRMEPEPEGGFILKCADLLTMSWSLENKWSPVAPFHHKMKFDLDYMDEAYVKIISQTHKQLSDPTIQTEERTGLLAKIISTCREAKGGIDPESDLESKTTERDNDIEKRDSENEKRDSEVMAPPKSLPKKVKQKSSIATAQKRAIDDKNDDDNAKKMKLTNDGAKKNILDVGKKAGKSKINDVVNEGGKKTKINAVSEKNVKKVASSKNVKENTNNVDDKDNTKPKNIKETKKTDDNIEKTNPKNKNVKESANTENKDGNIKPKSKQPIDSGNVGQDKTNAKSKNLNAKEVINQKAGNPKDNNINQEENNVKSAKSSESKKTKIVANGKSKEKIHDVERPKSKTIEKKSNVAITKNVKNNPVKTFIKAKTVTDLKTKENNVANTKNDDQETRKALEQDKNKEKIPEIANKGLKKTVKSQPVLNAKNDNTFKKVTERNATNYKIKDKISQIRNKDSEKNVIDRHSPNLKEIAPDKASSSNVITKKTIEITNIKKLTEPIKTMKNITRRISSHRNPLKVQNPQKTVISGNTKIFNTASTEKENSGKSKIPQKKLTSVRESSLKKNPLRISPRQIPHSKFKTSSQANTKTTNIPRLLKKPSPKTNIN